MKDRSYLESFFLFLYFRCDLFSSWHDQGRKHAVCFCWFKNDNVWTCCFWIVLFTLVFFSEETSAVTPQPVNNKCDVEALFVKTSANDSPVRAVIQFDMSLIVLFWSHVVVWGVFTHQFVPERQRRNSDSEIGEMQHFSRVAMKCKRSELQNNKRDFYIYSLWNDCLWMAAGKSYHSLRWNMSEKLKTATKMTV